MVIWVSFCDCEFFCSESTRINARDGYGVIRITVSCRYSDDMICSTTVDDYFLSSTSFYVQINSSSSLFNVLCKRCNIRTSSKCENWWCYFYFEWVRCVFTSRRIVKLDYEIVFTYDSCINSECC